MSYRDLRNFSEAMRVLGFPRAISLESFRVPNWQLMEECVRWLASRLHCDDELPPPPADKVQLVAQAIALFHSRANLKLNGKRVYGADGWAVRELLKVASFLRDALAAPPPEPREDAASSYDVSSRLGEIKQARGLSTEITAQGAFLYDLLGKETENKESRERALSRPPDMRSLEAGVRRALAAAAARADAARAAVHSVAASEAALDDKLARRRADLERAAKRLHAVQTIKPAYQGELSALESEVSSLWEQYVVRYRCVEALKHHLSVLETQHAEEAEEQQAAIMQLIHKYEAEDVLGKLSDSDEMSSSEEGAQASAARPPTRPTTRLRVKTAGGGEGGRAFVSAARDSLDDIRDEDDSRSDSDYSDTQLYGGEAAGRWSRPGTRTITAAHDHYTDLHHGGEESLGSSSESELRVGSAAPTAPRLSQLSDNEF